MADNYVFETSEDGRYRVRVEHDEYGAAPDWDDPHPDEIRAWEQGECYGIVVEERTQWARLNQHGEVTVLSDTRETWECVDSCFGFYGLTSEQIFHLKDTAREMLAAAMKENA